MGYYSKALLYMEGDKNNVNEMVKHINTRSARGSSIRLVGTNVSEYNCYDLISDYLKHETLLFEDTATIIFTMGWFKAYSEWDSAIEDIKGKSKDLNLSFHYCRFGENVDDVVIDNPEDGPEIGIERRFVIPEELSESFENIEVL